MNKQNRATPTTPQATMSQHESKAFYTINGNSLAAQKYKPLQLFIEKILLHGIFVFAGGTKARTAWGSRRESNYIA